MARAQSYSVYESTTSASSGYALAASGLTTTSWTSGALTRGKSYWFEVKAVAGSNWAGASSSSTGPRVISSGGCS